LETELLLCGEGTAVTRQELVEAGLVGDQGGLPEVDGESPEEGEVVLHHGEAAHHRARVPPLRIERGLDQGRIGGVQAVAGRTGETAQHTVGRVDELLAQGAQGQELAAEGREVPPVARHLDGVVRWADRLRGEARVRQGDLHRGGYAVRDLQHAGGWIGRAGGIYPVEGIVRAAVPEAPEVEDGVDVEGRVAARHL